MGILILLLFCGGIGYYAHRKGRNAFLWVLLAVLLSPLIAGVILALLKDKKTAEDISELRMEQDHLRDRISGDERLNDLRFRRLDEQLGSGKTSPALAENSDKQNDGSLPQQLDQSTRYCAKCGAALKPDDQFCPHCGTYIERSTDKNGQ